MSGRLVQLQQVDDFRRLLVAWVDQSVAVLVAKLPIDLDVGMQAEDASTAVEVIRWQVPSARCAVLQVCTVASGVHEEGVVFLVGASPMMKLSVQGLTVSPASTIAVAVVAVLVVLAGFALSFRLVTVTSTRVMRSWFFDTVVSKSHFALRAVAFDVVI